MHTRLHLPEPETLITRQSWLSGLQPIRDKNDPTQIIHHLVFPARAILFFYEPLLQTDTSTWSPPTLKFTSPATASVAVNHRDATQTKGHASVYSEKRGRDIFAPVYSSPIRNRSKLREHGGCDESQSSEDPLRRSNVRHSCARAVYL